MNNQEMRFSVFNKKNVDATKQPMFFGEPVNVARYDKSHYEIFAKLFEKQVSQFWRPEEVDVSRDRIDFNTKLTEAERHIFTSNLLYQTLLDSIQGRSPSIALLPLISIPELEEFVTAWAFMETIHSSSYTHIIRNVYNNPSSVFDGLMLNDAIMKRAKSIGKYYDDVIEAGMRHSLGMEVDMRDLKRKLLLCMVAVNALEAIRFYVSFACSFTFAERELMEGNAKIIKLIARDEAVHLSATQHIINIWQKGEDDPEMAELWFECYDNLQAVFLEVVEQEKEWAAYLFQHGSMIGLNKDILCQYIEYITNLRMTAIGLPMPFPKATSNPITWINSWLTSDNVQVAPQETEISSYLVGQVDAEVNAEDLANFEI